jgi:hypothetical protein
MKKYSSSGQLKPAKVLDSIPEEWNIVTRDHSMVNYLKNMFEHLLTVEENVDISERLSNMETLNKEKEANELKSSYLVIGDESMCKVCNRKLSYKFIRIYPNGGVYHTLCAKESYECPITR